MNTWHRSAFIATFTFACLAAAAAACSNETIVLASVVLEDDAGGTSHVTQTCVGNSECEENEYCQLDTVVNGITFGHCAHRPFECSQKKVDPMCGSNGITYVNDCYRKQAGVMSSTEGECPSEQALRCSLSPVRIDCPLDATCELLGGGQPGGKFCGSQDGHCWGIARIDCDDDNGSGPRWDECSTAPGALRCVSACTAIQSGRAYAHAEFGCTNTATPADAGPKP